MYRSCMNLPFYLNYLLGGIVVQITLITYPVHLKAWKLYFTSSASSALPNQVPLMSLQRSLRLVFSKKLTLISHIFKLQKKFLIALIVGNMFGLIHNNVIMNVRTSWYQLTYFAFKKTKLISME